MKLKISKKSVALVMAMVLAFGCGIGGTLAWLTASTGEVVNTFTVGDINLTLDESILTAGTLNTDTRVTKNDYHILPGTTQPKDPIVTVVDGSEACWLFVEITENHNYVKVNGAYELKEGTTEPSERKFIDWAANLEDWTFLKTDPAAPDEKVSHVYYKNVTSAMVPNASYYVLDGTTYSTGEVSYSSALTKAELSQIKTTKATLDFKAYAIQSEGFATAESAWNEINK